MFEALMPHLATHYWLIAPDLPGFGNSFIPEEIPLSMTIWGEAIQTGLSTEGINNYFLFGHHTGAAVALYLTATYPQQVRALAMCGPPLLTDNIKQTLRHQLPTLTPTETGDFLVTAWQYIRGKAKSIPLALSLREFRLSLALGNRYQEAYEAVFAYDFRGDLAKVTCPTLLLAGEQDSLYTYLPPTAKLVPQATIQVVPNAGTYICEEQPAVLADLLKEIFV